MEFRGLKPAVVFSIISAFLGGGGWGIRSLKVIFGYVVNWRLAWIIYYMRFSQYLVVKSAIKVSPG